MTPTETLHAMLDERGVEYRFNEITKVFEWHFDGTDGEGSAHATEVNGGINIIACSLTPEQAIVATLGRGTCHNIKASWPSLFECDECGYSNDDTYYGSEGHFKFCPNCGAKVVDV